MSVTQRLPLPNILPDNAPFTPEQRAWLNGLFAGLFGLENGVTPLSSDDAAKLLPGLMPGAAYGVDQFTPHAITATRR